MRHQIHNNERTGVLCRAEEGGEPFLGERMGRHITLRAGTGFDA